MQREKIPKHDYRHVNSRSLCTMGLHVILFSSLYSVFQSLYDGHVVFVIFAMKEKGKAGRERDKEEKRERGNGGTALLNVAWFP